MTLWETFLAHLRAEPRKAGVLGFLTLVLLGVGARLVWKAPAESIAATTAAAATGSGTAAGAATPVAAVAQGGSAALAAIAIKTAGDVTRQIEDHNARLAAELGMLESAKAAGAHSIEIGHFSRTMARDLFETDWNTFVPSAETLAAQAQDRPAAPRVGEQWRGICAGFVKLMRDYRLRQNKLDDEAQKLKLQAVLLAPTARAYVGGRWVQVGTVIGGFEVLEISAAQVSLRKSGCLVRLTMP